MTINYLNCEKRSRSLDFIIESFCLLALIILTSGCAGKNNEEIRGVFICQNPDKNDFGMENLEFRSDDIVMLLRQEAHPYPMPVNYTREGNFIYLKEPLFPVSTIKIVSSSRLEEDAPSNPYVWVKSQ